MDNEPESEQIILGYLTHDIIDARGILLLAEGTPLTPKIVQQIQQHGLIFNIATEPLGRIVAEHAVFKIPDKLEKKFTRIDGARIDAAAGYMKWVLNRAKENIFLNNNLKILAQGHRATYSHSINVSLIAVAIAQKLNFSQAALHEIALGALYHDIGKILLPKTVLDDMNGVAEGQTLIYQQHTILGGDLLAAEKLPLGISLIAQQHHEKISGNGYPKGLQGYEIHFNAAVVAVADVFDRLTSGVFQSPVFTADEALEQIRQAKGIDYHPQVVEAFLELLPL